MIATLIDAHLGRRLREARNEAGISQPALAQALGISPQQVSKLELGANAMHAAHIYNASIALNRAPGWFFDGLPGLRSAAS